MKLIKVRYIHGNAAVNGKVDTAIAILNVECINAIVNATQYISFDGQGKNINTYNVCLNNIILHVLPEDMQPIWDSIGMKL